MSRSPPHRNQGYSWKRGKGSIEHFFYSELNKEICRLETMITSKQTKTEGIVYRILSEKIWSKQTDEVITRKSMLDFDDKEPVCLEADRRISVR